MARIRTSNNTTGRPGFGVKRSVSGFSGVRAPSDLARPKGVRRLFSRDPSKGAFSQFGTKRDILNFDNSGKVPNPTPGSNPEILKAAGPRRSVVTGIKGVGIGRINRSLRKR